MLGPVRALPALGGAVTPGLGELFSGVLSLAWLCAAVVLAVDLVRNRRLTIHRSLQVLAVASVAFSGAILLGLVAVGEPIGRKWFVLLGLGTLVLVVERAQRPAEPGA